MSDEIFDAIVTLRFKIPYVCRASDLDEKFTFYDCVESLLVEEGIAGIAENMMTPDIVSIRKIRRDKPQPKRKP